METQKSLMPSILSKHLGLTYEAIIDEISNKTVKMRTYFQAPDIDGRVYMYAGDLKNNSNYKQGGGFTSVTISKIKDYDLLGVDPAA